MGTCNEARGYLNFSMHSDFIPGSSGNRRGFPQKTIESMKPSPRIFVYKMTTDNGGAPCVHNEILSLAICKPKIRGTANAGDWVIGVGGKRLGKGVIYVARVSKAVGVEYYINRKFATRPDCIYRRTGSGELVRKAGAQYHEAPGNRYHDVGSAPKYRRARVLWCKEFRYFGENREPIPVRLREFITSIGRGHRVNLSTAVHKSLVSFIRTVQAKYRKRILGKSIEKPSGSSRCNTDHGSAEVCR